MINIALSIGHGKKTINGQEVYDPGACWYGLQEYEECSEIVNMIQYLCEPHSGIKIYPIMSKTLPRKVAEINRLNCDYAVEVHLNVSLNPSIRGSEVLYYPESEEGQRLAILFSGYFSEILHTRNRGAKGRADLCFLRETNCPAIITEAEFISNHEVSQALKSGFLKQCIAFAHAKAMTSKKGA